jgi:hypothetical protein
MIAKLLREPLLYFLLAGAALFLITDALGGDAAERIVVSDAERARLAAQWQAQMGRPPTDTELDGLIQQWLREEIYYREAKAMGLDEDDVIIRRRLAQKLTFLTEDLATAAAPDEAALRRYYQDNAERYQEPERWSFSHRYFSGERREQAEADARAALQTLKAGDEGVGGEDAGDPFMLQRSYVERAQREIGELFGREFAAAVTDLPVGGWHGPVRSAYGWHLVKVEDHEPARQRPFEEVVDQVATDYRQQQRREANEAYFESLLERYEIVRS